MTAKKDYTSIIFVLGVLVFYTAWMLASPYAAPPDENMRYDIPMYIYKYGVLPRGDDPALINNAWGLSYAYFPILSYMVSALFMKVVSVFSTEPLALLMAARFFSVLCGVGICVFKDRQEAFWKKHRPSFRRNGGISAPECFYFILCK